MDAAFHPSTREQCDFRKLSMKNRFLTFALFALFGACATPPPAPDSVSSPASPHAPESNRLDAQQTLARHETSRKITARLKETANPDVRHTAHSKSKDSTHKPRQDEAAAMYSCPMHPEVRQNQPGECPICGMALVEKESSKRKGDYR